MLDPMEKGLRCVRQYFYLYIIELFIFRLKYASQILIDNQNLNSLGKYMYVEQCG
jgi:hypothetical protein